MKKFATLAITLALTWSCSSDDNGAKPVPDENSAPKMAAQAFTANENIGDAVVIGTVKATDEDGDKLSFSIKTDASDLFEVSTAGELSLATGSSLDFGKAESHKITIAVSDGEDTASADVTINVTNVNVAPVFGEESYGFEVAEGIDDATVIGTVTATDGDGNTLAYGISADDSGLFEINADGELTLVTGSSLDFSKAESHTITVQVTDGTADPVTVEVTINVTSVNAAPVFGEEAYGFEAAEDIDDATVIGTVTATDGDDDTLAFGISADDSGLFEINTDGELTLATGKSLDFETEESHTITIQVTDGTADPVTVEVTIVVTNVIESLSEDPASFITTWDIPQGNFELTIGTNPNFANNFTIDWGDGTVEDLAVQDPTHVYQSAGTYTVAIQGDFPAIEMGDINASHSELASIDQWGTMAWKSMNGAFSDCENMVYKATDIPDLSQVTDMSFMFYGATSFNGNPNSWDVSNVTDMSYMFAYTESFTYNLGGWDTGNVTTMESMFAGATHFNGSPNLWDVSNVTNMRNMFNGATSFNRDLNGWDTGNVTKMSGMFNGATAFNKDISGWDTGSVNTMQGMFQDATSFNKDISGWDTGSVNIMSGMFNDATSFDQNLGNWDIGNVTTMFAMLDSSGLSNQNYSATLVGWSDINAPANISLGADFLQRCNTPSVIAAHTYLVNDKGWTIDDHGVGVCN